RSPAAEPDGHSRKGRAVAENDRVKGDFRLMCSLGRGGFGGGVHRQASRSLSGAHTSCPYCRSVLRYARTGGARPGYAAAVHGALRIVDTPARRRSAWERRRDRLHREQQELRTQMSAQSRYLTSKLGLGRGAGFCLCIGLVPFMLGTAEMFGLLVTGVAL